MNTIYLLDGVDYDWLGGLHALCSEYEVDLWFPDVGEYNIKWELPRAICNRCEAKEACLNFALKTKEKFGMWGGKTPKERVGLL